VLLADAKAAFRNAKQTFGKNSPEALAAKAERDMMKQILADAKSTLQVSRLELKTFNNEVFKPAKQELAALKAAYVDLRRVA